MSIISENLIKGANEQSFFGGTGNVLEREATEKVNSFESHFDGIKKRLGGFTVLFITIVRSESLKRHILYLKNVKYILFKGGYYGLYDAYFHR